MNVSFFFFRKIQISFVNKKKIKICKEKSDLFLWKKKRFVKKNQICLDVIKKNKISVLKNVKYVFV